MANWLHTVELPDFCLLNNIRSLITPTKSKVDCRRLPNRSGSYLGEPHTESISKDEKHKEKVCVETLNG